MVYFIRGAPFLITRPARTISGTGIYMPNRGFVTFEIGEGDKLKLEKFYDEPEVLEYLHEHVEGEGSRERSLVNLRQRAQQLCIPSKLADCLIDHGRASRDARARFEEAFTKCINAEKRDLPETDK